MQNQSNSQNPFYNEQADQRYTARPSEMDNLTTEEDSQLSTDDGGSKDAESQVRSNEDASLQDKEYAFDEDNTGTEEYHDADSEEDAGDHAFDI